MTITRRFTIILSSLVLMVGMATASDFTLLSAGNGTGLSDGAHYVGFVELMIDGQNYSAMCIDSLHEASVGDTWSGIVTPLTDTAALTQVITDQFGKMTPDTFNPKLGADAIAYYMMLDNPDNQAVINLQHSAWSQFDARYDGGQQLADLAALILTNGSIGSGNGQTSVSINNFSIVTDSSNLRQAFIISSTPDPTPEPITLGLMGAGLVLLGLLRHRGC